MIEEQDVEQEETMPGRFELKPTLEKVWHAPDNFRFMDPLPPMHRRGIIIAAIVLVVGFLLPSDDTPNASVVTREAQLDIQSQSQPPTEEQPQTTQTQPFQPDSGIDNQWRSYRVEPGKTMAQLFRDHGLPATDVYAMAQVEGAGKPLSNLQNGQMVKIRQNASGVVTGLTIDTGNNQQVLFTRQPDGSFIRAR
ncbi:hypothetical protein BW725_14465 [Shigella flexneri]|uniref:Opacity-associated protein A n=17 Tax=Shigella flexneri TaxID=623 RepID=A0A0H2VZV9_SHIFL|nr:OapA family protein [Shigella flexneri]NP_709991.1 hypothetical protein SF4280 [Shigella flexneri 2a str. 301]AAP19483.1 hypothetical protein S4545 [Shigella flexneri 2a str. 2457T]ADA76574.1 hypothetical protein SFxv_4669 [Shigella flexneri 2002017]AAN45698.1 conserved hypothetical protein [Shigella flexneri 2a str. 301]OUJ78600.1 hypothetical protein BW725_14465 [Shigella flexneri]OXB26140.1 hypothetical protein SF301_4797 [Shigella flexneri 2a str. 301]